MANSIFVCPPKNGHRYILPGLFYRIGKVDWNFFWSYVPEVFSYDFPLPESYKLFYMINGIAYEIKTRPDNNQVIIPKSALFVFEPVITGKTLKQVWEEDKIERIIYQEDKKYTSILYSNKTSESNNHSDKEDFWRYKKKEYGEQDRILLELDKYDNNSNPMTILFPKEVSLEYLTGLLKDSILKFERSDRFLNKYNFKYTDYYIHNLFQYRLEQNVDYIVRKVLRDYKENG